MRITFFIGSLSGGGAERVTCNLANSLALKGHEVDILTMSDKEATYSLSHSVKRKSLILQHERKGFLYNSLLRLKRFAGCLRKSDADVFIVMLPVTTIMLLQMKWLMSAKVIASERVDPSIYPEKKQKLLKRLAHKADGWVFQTEEERLWYGKSTGKSNVTIIPNAINSDFVKPAYAGERRKIIVTAGRLTAQKNHALLLNAFALIHRNYSDYKLVIYGDGDKKDELQRLVNELGLTNKVEMPGYTTDIGEAIYDASLFVLSSDYEGMPNALMEAMALGVPCVSTDCDGGGARFLIENKKNGLLVPKGDVDALANAMEQMLSNREFAEKCGREAHQICERLAPEKIYGEWEQFIKEIVECGKREYNHRSHQ